MGLRKTGIFVFSHPRKILFFFPVLLVAAVNGNRAEIRLTIIWIFRKILETDRIKTRKLFRNFQNFPDFSALFSVAKRVFQEQSFPIVPMGILILENPNWIPNTSFPILLETLLPIALIQSVSNITPTYPRSVAVNHAGLWIRRHQFESGRGYPEFFIK